MKEGEGFMKIQKNEGGAAPFDAFIRNLRRLPFAMLFLGVFLFSTIANAAGKFEDFKYLFPNEYYGNIYDRVTAQLPYGAIAGAGSFRLLERLPYGNFSSLIFVDINPKMVEFNRLNVEIILAEHTRLDYLAALFSRRKLTPRELSSFSEMEPEKQIRAILALPFDQQPQTEAQKSILNLFGYPGSSLRKRIESDAVDNFDQADIYFTYGGGENKNFLINDQLYLQMREKLQTVTTFFLEGNLSTLPTINDLTKILTTAQTKLSALDISNIMDYFSNADFLEFSENIQTLPILSDSRIFRTVFSNMRRSIYPQPSDRNYKATFDGFAYISEPFNRWFRPYQSKKADSLDESFQLSETSFCNRLLQKIPVLKNLLGG
jgi:hypothetical protein